MKCEVCNQGPPHGPAIYRVNAVGEMPPRWRCDKDLTAEQKAAIDLEVQDIVKTVESARPPTPFEFFCSKVNGGVFSHEEVIAVRRREEQ